MATLHDLKCWPEPFAAMWDGRKRAEFRWNDRNFQEGDTLRLHEWKPDTREYTNRVMYVDVMHLIRGRNGTGFGIPEGYVMMSVNEPLQVARVKWFSNPWEGSHRMAKPTLEDARACLQYRIDKCHPRASETKIARVKELFSGHKVGDILFVTDVYDNRCTIEVPLSLEQIAGNVKRGVGLTTASPCVGVPIFHVEFEPFSDASAVVAVKPNVTTASVSADGITLDGTIRLDWFADVLAFHRKFGCATGTTPALVDGDVRRLRISLIDEEGMEFVEALRVGDLPGIADGAIDLIYVVLGTLVAYGIDANEVWAAVHSANMAKEGGGKRGDGKILKSSTWVAPDVAGLLERQGPITD